MLKHSHYSRIRILRLQNKASLPLQPSPLPQQIQDTVPAAMNVRQSIACMKIK